MHYVIIGNSTAAIGAVEGIRSIDEQGKITLVTSEVYPTYSRPLISYLLQGKTTEENMRYRDASFYSNNKVEVMAGVTATKVQTATKQVFLDNGKSISYDKLLVATGSSPFVPSYSGIDTVEHKYTFMSLDDAKGLSKVIDESKHVLILGAGLIGLKCAEGILARVKQVTVVNRSPKVLSSVLDDAGAKRVENHLKEQGVELVLASTIERFEGNTAVLSNGSTIGFDVLVIALSATPNTALLEGIAEIDKGILINAESKTSAVDIYAAGDCTQGLDCSSNQSKVMAVLPNAAMQGECAGINMAGGEKTFAKALPLNAVGFFGLHVLTAGTYDGDEYLHEESTSYKRLFYQDNALCGFILIGEVEKAGIYTSLIREKTPLDTLDFALMCEKPGLMAFTKEKRTKVLGGTVE